MILEELGLKYTVERVLNKKAEWYTKINPNGRCPSIKDPNTGVTIWEVGMSQVLLVGHILTHV
jgi:glutathione S-transferase